MKSISKLKDDARRHEQREEWEKAIEVYLQVVRLADESDAEVDLPLFNRLGDLCVRLGRPQDAMRHYEQAADRYAEAGLYNNAIALCNKALRYSPDRLELIRKLGQFSAEQGFVTDARRYYLDYAERQFNSGQIDDGFAALSDFANLVDDASVRELLGRRLQAHGRTADAVRELGRAHVMYASAGDTDKAQALQSEITSLDPTAQPAADRSAPLAGDPTAAAQPGTELPGLPELHIDSAAFDRTDAPAVTVPDLEPDTPDMTDPAVEGFEIEGFAEADVADLDAIASVGDGMEGLETTTLDFSTVDTGTDMLGDIELDRPETSFDESGFDSFDFLAEDDAGEALDLPLLESAPHASGILDPGAVPLAPPPPDSDSGAPDLSGLGDSDTAGFDGAADEAPFADGDDGAAFDLPLLDDPDPAYDLPTFDDPAPSTFEMPPLHDPLEATLDLPTLDEPAAPFDGGPDTLDLPSFDEPTDAAAAAEAEDAESAAEPVDTSFDWMADAGSFEFPSFEAPAAPAVDFGRWDDEPGDVDPLPSPDDAEERHDAVGDMSSAVMDDLEEQPQDAVTGHPAANAAVPEVVETDTATEPLVVPPIELPTWDLEPAASEASAASFELSSDVPAEAERPADREAPALAHESDDERDADAVSGTAPDSAVAEHASGAAPGGAAAGSMSAGPIAAEAAAEADGFVAAETDWLAAIDADERDHAASAASAEDTVAAALEGAAEAAALEAAIEDAAAAERQAERAQKEMAAAPPPADYIDLGAFLTAEDKESGTRFRVQESAPSGDEDRDFAELLNQFKAKVLEHLPPEDATAHYDLGIAFKEMGLIDEAIGEFQVALRGGHTPLQVYEELGHCFLQKEQYNIAEKVLTRALAMRYDDELELLGVYYHLGRAYEALGRPEQARDAYERVLGMDIAFLDVSQRLAGL